MWKNIVGIIVLQLLLVGILSSVGLHSFISGLFVTAITCSVSAVFYNNVSSARIRYLFIVVAPLYISYCLYWLPTSSSGGGAEYSAWELIFVIPCFIVGLISSIATYFISSKLNKRS